MTAPEAAMVKFCDLLTVKVRECGEPFVPLKEVSNGYLPGMSDMDAVTGPLILVRSGVYEKLKTAGKVLKNIGPGLNLYVTYGYRTLEIQKKRFLKQLRSVASAYFPDPVDLYEKVHQSVAVPSVAGHPAGAAVDIYIPELDFGSDMYDYTTEKYYVFSGEINGRQKESRMLLRRVMMKAGFAPYDGEWWHFSYGDREWAYYYKKDCAFYDQKHYPFSTSQK